jgi:hypothetical protein
MEYRNAGQATHHGKGLVTGVDGDNGVSLSSNIITAASDSANADLIVKGKGTGGVYIGNSTAATKGVWAGTAVAPSVLLPVSGLVVSTITIPGVVAGDGLFIGRATAQMSTALAMAGSWVSGTDEGSFAVLTNQASTQSIVAGSFPYIVVKA